MVACARPVGAPAPAVVLPRRRMRRTVATVTTVACRAEGREALLNEYAELACSLYAVLRSPEFKADAVTQRVRGARAFYDCERGLRVIVVTPHFWGEAWVHGPGTRRASMHTQFLEAGIVYQYCMSTRAITVVKNEGWPDDMLDFLYVDPDLV